MVSYCKSGSYWTGLDFSPHAIDLLFSSFFPISPDVDNGILILKVV
jgi:hypothetical protein